MPADLSRCRIAVSDSFLLPASHPYKNTHGACGRKNTEALHYVQSKSYKLHIWSSLCTQKERLVFFQTQISV